VQDDVRVSTAVLWVDAGPPHNRVGPENIARPCAFKSYSGADPGFQRGGFLAKIVMTMPTFPHSFGSVGEAAF
jgi:hypothetical protein